MDYNAISACAAVAASLTAVIALLYESRRTRFQAGVDMLLKFNDMFADDQMRKARRNAAKGIRRGAQEEAEDVLDFFEMVGLLVRRKAIDDDFVWHSFFYWVHRYYLVMEQYIASVRGQDKSIWSDLVWMHKRLCKVEKRIRRCSDDGLAVDKDELDSFLDEEEKA